MIQRLILFLALLLASPVFATEYYISPSGNDTTGTGAIGAPWLTITKFHTSAAAPGDILWVRGGTYTLAGPSNTALTKDGTSGNLITIQNYPGETPIFDGINLTATGGTTGSCLALNSASFWHIKGLKCTRASYVGFGVYGSSGNVTLEQNESYVNGINGDGFEPGGFQIISTGGSIHLINNDSHHNADTGSGGAADGFIVNVSGGDVIIRGNRAWFNSDDGFDFFNTIAGTNIGYVVENNWAWRNGYNEALTPLGNGTGFKLGGGASATTGGHTVRKNLAWKNLNTNFAHNSATNAITLYNNTAYDSVTDANYCCFGAGGVDVFRNNISFQAAQGNITDNDAFNSWNTPPGVTVSAADFQSLDFSGASGARQADGSLPNITFLKLVLGSDLIDAGTDVGIAFNGVAPDLGAFEFVPDTGRDPLIAPRNLTVTPRSAATSRTGATARSVAQ